MDRRKRSGVIKEGGGGGRGGERVTSYVTKEKQEERGVNRNH